MLKALQRGVVLAPLDQAHAATTFAWMSDPSVRRHVGLRAEPSLEGTRAWIARASTNPTMSAFAILHDGSHVGNVVLDRIDTYLSAARLSVYLGESSARGAGIGATGCYLAVEHGFGALALHKVWLTVNVRNAAAIRTY